MKVKNGIKYVFAEHHLLKKLIIWRHQISYLELTNSENISLVQNNELLSAGSQYRSDFEFF